jgi:lipopolysaccharide export system protein LptA
MHHYIRLYLILTIALLVTKSSLWAQIEPAPTPTDTSIVEIIYAETTSRDLNADMRLMGNVMLKQKDVFFYSSRAIVHPNNQVGAAGVVKIKQRDSLEIFSDSLFYDGMIKKSWLFGNVSLSDKRAVLFTPNMEYDMNNKVATYNNGGTLKKEKARLTSDKGVYFVDSSMAYFKGNVILKHPDCQLFADTLAYNTDKEIAYFHGPTKIIREDKTLTCTAGYYDTKLKYAVFEGNPMYYGKNDTAYAKQIIYDGKMDAYYLIGDAHFKDSTRTIDADKIIYQAKNKTFSTSGRSTIKQKGSNRVIVADKTDRDETTGVSFGTGNVIVYDSVNVLNTDTLIYNEKTHWGNARGKVIWRDTVSGNQIECGAANYNDSTGYLKAYKHPVMTTIIDGDSLWLTADTLHTYKNHPKDAAKQIKAYHHVKFFKSDLQGVCDSLFYSDVDSVFYLYKKPVLWADTTQFTADTMAVYLKQKSISLVRMLHNSFIVNSPDVDFYNQIKGVNIDAHFVNKQVRTMNAFDEGESVYYAQDDSKAYIGVKKVLCDDMKIYFGDNKVEKIMYYTEPTGAFYPMRQIDHNTLKIKGFVWYPELKPKSKEEIFRNGVTF